VTNITNVQEHPLDPRDERHQRQQLHNGNGRYRPYHHDQHYRGHVSPYYTRGCFEFNYWGPSFFAGVCWYPRWSPWLHWSSHYHCHPIWDPRPIWCRPVIYDPCPAWVYYPAPVWTPLPAVAAGTWVDVPPVAVAPQQHDLQLLAVRFVDPGHPEEKLGPRFRVWFRNNSPEPITRPFDVVMLAGVDRELVAGLPQARRPRGLGRGRRHAIGRRPPPLRRLNMGHEPAASRRRSARCMSWSTPTAKSPRSPAPTTARCWPWPTCCPWTRRRSSWSRRRGPGGEVLLAGEGFGPEPDKCWSTWRAGIRGEISGWYDLGVRFRLPAAAAAAAAPAEVIVVRGDGAAANPLKLTVLPR